MQESKCTKCHSPQLCLIACPDNSILRQLSIKEWKRRIVLSHRQAMRVVFSKGKSDTEKDALE